MQPVKGDVFRAAALKEVLFAHTPETGATDDHVRGFCNVFVQHLHLVLLGTFQAATSKEQGERACRQGQARRSNGKRREVSRRSFGLGMAASQESKTPCSRYAA